MGDCVHYYGKTAGVGIGLSTVYFLTVLTGHGNFEQLFGKSIGLYVDISFLVLMLFLSIYIYRWGIYFNGKELFFINFPRNLNGCRLNLEQAKYFFHDKDKHEFIVTMNNGSTITINTLCHEKTYLFLKDILTSYVYE